MGNQAITYDEKHGLTPKKAVGQSYTIAKNGPENVIVLVNMVIMVFQFLMENVSKISDEVKDCLIHRIIIWILILKNIFGWN